MSIRHKIFKSFTTVLLITSIAACVGILLVYTTGINYTNCLNYFGTTQGLSGRIGLALNNSYDALVMYQSNPNENQKTALEQQLTYLESLRASLASPIQNAKISPGGTQERTQIVPSIQNSFQTLDTHIQNYIATCKSIAALPSPEASASRRTQELDPIYTQSVQMIDQFIDQLYQTATVEQDYLAVGITFFIGIIVLVILLAALVSLAITNRLSRHISTPAKQMQIAANELAQGNLKVEIACMSQDEIGSLAQALSLTVASLKSYIDEIRRVLGEMADGNFNVNPQVDFKGDFSEIQDSLVQIIQSMKDTFSKMRIASDQVNEDSKLLSSGSATLSRGTEEQSASIQTLYETITDISTQLHQTAAKAEESSKIVQQTGHEMENSNQHMGDMISSMEIIHRTSSQIGKIMSTVNDIAMQTNILSLNASIEASRAGAAGKGFSVVAGEIRNLAVKSAQAAKDTASLIEDSIRSVEEGYAKADETARTLSSTSDLIRGSIQLIDEIAHATTLQSQLINQFTVGIEQISSVVQDNSHTALLSSSVSQELFHQSSVLNQLLLKFQP